MKEKFPEFCVCGEKFSSYTPIQRTWCCGSEFCHWKFGLSQRGNVEFWISGKNQMFSLEEFNRLAKLKSFE